MNKIVQTMIGQNRDQSPGTNATAVAQANKAIT